MIEETQKNWIVIPVYNDWESLQMLIKKISAALSSLQENSFRYLIIDDGSNIICNKEIFKGVKVEYLKLRRNMGHQRAIACGLSYLNSKGASLENVIIMDADGEDDPFVIPLLFRTSRENTGKIIFSARTKRKERFLFKLGYSFYKMMFRLLTGKKISFGNFSLIPGGLVHQVVNISEIWNHYSGGVMKAGIPFLAVPSPRSERFAGKSSMNMVSLILHGLRSMAVYLDRVAARLLLFFVMVCFLLGLGMLVVIYFKFFTDLAIPGWATSAMSGLTILLFQALLISLFIVFIALNQNTQRQIIPAIDYKDYIESVETFDE